QFESPRKVECKTLSTMVGVHTDVHAGTAAPAKPESLPDWRALALAAAGMLLTFGAPQHRVDLLAIGVIAALGGIVWSPIAGPLLIGATLPVFFFSRTLAGPLAVTPP